MTRNRRAFRVGARIASRGIRPVVEGMEPRQLLTTITVTSAADTIANDGVVTLREAITAANTDAAAGDAPAGSAGLDTINFNIPGTGVQTIALQSNLPAITGPVVIDGYSQPGANANTAQIDSPDNATILIRIDGAAPLVYTGLELDASNSTIRGLSITGVEQYVNNSIDAPGILLGPGASQNTIEGNFIGIDPAGTGTDAEKNRRGIVVQGSDNTIGGTTAGARNVISNNVTGIQIGILNGTADRTLVQGNYIGTDPTGTTALLNDTGISIFVGNDTTIGGTTAEARNVISGNNTGIQIGTRDATINRTLIQGNYIGIDRTGTNALPNNFGIEKSAGNDTTIGGTVAGAGNLIGGNLIGMLLASDRPGTGTLVQGNAIGTDFSGTRNLGNTGIGIDATHATNATIGGTAAGEGNLIAFTGGPGAGITTIGEGVSILGNSIFGNNGPGIRESVGASMMQPPAIAPILTSATASTITGKLQDVASTQYRIEFFATPATGTKDTSQGKTYLGFLDVTTDASGLADFSFSPAGEIPSGVYITATSTRLDAVTTAPVATSAFSAAFSSEPVPTIDVVTPDPQPYVGPRYTIHIANIGGAAVGGAELTMAMPAHTTFVALTLPPGWTATTPAVGSAGNIVVVADSMATGESVVFVLAYAIDLAQVDPVGSNYHQVDFPLNATITVQDDSGMGIIASASATTTFGFGMPMELTPSVSDDAYAVTAGQPLIVSAPGVLANDRHLGLGTLTVAVGTGPAHGRLTLTPDGSFVYTPDAGFAGVDHFTYVASNSEGGDSARGTVSLTVAAAAATPATNPPPPPQVDTTAPQMVSLQRFGYREQPTVLVLAFDEGLTAAGATDPANYRLVAAGRDGKFNTRDDVTIHLKKVTYDTTTHTVRLELKRRLPLSRHAQVTIRNLTDPSGNAVAVAGKGGTDVRRFDGRILAGRSSPTLSTFNRLTFAKAKHD